MTGHAAFHLQHDAHGERGNRADRRRILHESMRHLDPRDVRRHAAKNPNIVATDAHLNESFVNDGRGGFTFAPSVAKVLDYGDARLAGVRRKITADQKTVNRFVVHLPKNLCREIPDYYPRRNNDGSERLDPATGEPMSRSRWVARDRDEALRYFRDAIAYLAVRVIPGGQAAIHGWATNYDESTPHIQLMADPFAPDPKAPASQPVALRTMQSQAYSSHRDVRGADGRQLSGAEKLREYQRGLREHMLARGWPVEKDVSARHGKEMPKAEFEAAQDAEATARAALAAAQRERGDADALAAQTRQIGYGVLDRIDAEHERVRRLPAMFDAFLDAPLKAGGTLRPAFERYTASLSKTPVSSAQIRRELDDALPRSRRRRAPSTSLPPAAERHAEMQRLERQRGDRTL